MQMYKGYYIDKVVFNSKKEIDDFIKKQAVDRFMWLNKYFADNCTMEASVACTEQARILHNKFGFSWEEIEEMEIKAIA